VLLNLDAAYPNQRLTLVLEGDAIKNPQQWKGKKICVEGMIMLYKGKPQVVVRDLQSIFLPPSSPQSSRLEN
jgi:DNA/RNA endonuclease YhcR with UshA esterase domain